MENLSKISIHAPIVGCDAEKSTRFTIIQQFQSTHPSWGATLRFLHNFSLISYFNPRTHRGVRQDPADIPLSPFTISIHAPIVGCDTASALKVREGADFNPRTHRGVRLFSRIIKLSISRFQSTHPSWGATLVFSLSTLTVSISIHAPIVGCDDLFLLLLPLKERFQSTHPSWGATMGLITAIYIRHYFNPRTHRGVRHS